MTALTRHIGTIFRAYHMHSALFAETQGEVAARCEGQLERDGQIPTAIRFFQLSTTTTTTAPPHHRKDAYQQKAHEQVAHVASQSSPSGPALLGGASRGNSASSPPSMLWLIAPDSGVCVLRGKQRITLKDKAREKEKNGKQRLASHRLGILRDGREEHGKQQRAKQQTSHSLFNKKKRGRRNAPMSRWRRPLVSGSLSHWWLSASAGDGAMVTTSA